VRGAATNRRRDHALGAAAAAILGLCLALPGCGDEEADGLAALVPPDTPFYAEAAIRPSGERLEAVEAITEKVAGIDDPGARIVDEFDAALADDDADFTYAADIEPWLGETAAVYVRSLDRSEVGGALADAAAIIDTTDPDAAVEAVQKAAESGDTRLETLSYEDVDYLLDREGDSAVGAVGDRLVVGTEAAFKAAVDASEGESLAQSDQFSEEVGSLGDDELAAVWMDLGTMLDAAAQGEDVDGAEIDAARAALGPVLEEPVTLSLGASPDAVSLDVSSAGEAGVSGDADALGALPADAWLGLAIEDAGAGLREAVSAVGSLGGELGDPRLDVEAVTESLRQQTGLDLDSDILAWVGDAALYVAGTSPADISVGAIVGTDDADRSLSAIEAFGSLVEAAAGRPAGPPRLEGADGGFAALAPTGQGIEVAQRGDQVVAAVGGANPAADALDPSAQLADDGDFDAATSALGGDFTPTVYLSLQPALEVAESGGSGLDPDFQAARPYLDAFTWLALGTTSADGRTRSRSVLGVAG
jgi:hypothetical protein